VIRLRILHRSRRSVLERVDRIGSRHWGHESRFEGRGVWSGSVCIIRRFFVGRRFSFSSLAQGLIGRVDELEGGGRAVRSRLPIVKGTELIPILQRLDVGNPDRDVGDARGVHERW
jgi:hypothetical protein